MVYNRNGIERTEFIKLKGLNDGDTYEISFASGAASVTAGGTYLMNRGIKVKTKSSEILYIKRVESASPDLTEFNEALEKAKKARLNIMTVETGFDLVKAINNADMIVAAGDAAKDINYKVATDELKKAQKALKIASTTESCESKLAQLDKVIDFIGRVNRDNFLDKVAFIEFAETAKEAILKKFSDAVIEKDGILTAARENYDRLTVQYIYGDMDGDGEILVNDALLALQAAVGKISADDTQRITGDVDGDGNITVTDALYILQFSVGKITAFAVR